jgi:hypothetical protein
MQWYKLSLLLVGLFLLSGPTGLGVGLTDTDEKKALAAVKALGGVANLIPTQPGVIDVDFGEVPIKDQDLKVLTAHLQRFTAIRSLFLSGTNITDNGLAYLKSWPKIEFLCLDRTSISSAGLGHIRP